jgi:FkbM family methyltransferase
MRERERERDSSRPKSGKNYPAYGHKQNITEQLLEIFFNILIKIFFINHPNKISNLFIQSLNPLAALKFQNHKLKFRTGHGRLLWRVKSFYSEEKIMVEWLKTFSQKDIFLDIGANVGIYTIPAAINAKHVYACELDFLNIGILKENIYLNNLNHKITILPFPALSNNKISKIYYRNFSKGDALQSINRKTLLNTNLEKSYSSTSLGFSLDYIFKKFKLKYPTKVKIDVDGNEDEVFKGASNVIFHAREVYFEDSGLKNCEKHIKSLINKGYKIVNSEKPKKAILGENLIFKRIN